MVDIPIKDENFATTLTKLPLTDLRRDADVVVEAEALRILSFSVMTRGSDDGKNALDFAKHYGSTRFDGTAS